jgi:hypothetical protein
MEQPQQRRDGKAVPRPLRRRLAEGVLYRWGIEHGAARAIDHKRAVAMPPAFARGTELHRTAAVLQEAGKAAQRESSMGLTIGGGTDPSARHMGQMTAGGVAVPHRPQKSLHGGDRHEHPVAPRGLPDPAAHHEHAARALHTP